MADKEEPTEEEKRLLKQRLDDILAVHNAGNAVPAGEEMQKKSVKQTQSSIDMENAAASIKRQASKQVSDAVKSMQQQPSQSNGVPSTPKTERILKVQNVPEPLVPTPSALQGTPLKIPDTIKTNKMVLPGAGNAVFLLGGTLAIVAIWNSVIHPLVELSWYGTFKKTKGITLPPSGIISLVLFILLITFISTLSPDFATVSLLFILGLWAVYLVMNPTVVQNAAAFVSQGNAPVLPTDMPPGAPNPHGGPS